MKFPSLEEVIACNEAVRGEDEASPTPDDDDVDGAAHALRRAQQALDAVDAAAALAFELTRAQAFFEGNKRTAAMLAAWFIETNTDLDPAQIVKHDDPEFGDLLVAAARGDEVRTQIRELFRRRASAAGRSPS